MAGELESGLDGTTANPTSSDPSATTQPMSPAPSATPAPAGPGDGAAGVGTPGAAAPQTAEQIARNALNQPAVNQPAAAAPAPPAWTPPTREQFDAMQRQAAEYQQIQAQLPQLQQYAQLGVEAYRQQQAARQQQLQREQQQAQAKSWFGLPEFNTNLLDFIETDPATGQVRAREGAPPDTLAQYRQFSKALQDTQLKFWTNPQAYLAEPVKQMAAQVAQQMIQQHMGGYEDRVTADKLIEQNSSWMFTQSPDGQQTFSPAGRLYAQAVQEANQMGIRGSQAQHKFATERVQLQLLFAQYQQQQQQQVGNAGKQQLLQQQFAGGSAATPPSVPVQAAVPAPDQPPMDLKRQLLANLKAAGHSNDTFRAA